MNILSFDIEEWWGYNHYNIGEKKDWLPRIEKYLFQTLDLLDEKEIKATFFILGEVAKSNPEVVRHIHARGHHIGCHSYAHKFWKDNTPEEVREDTRMALDMIENITGEKVNAYRAPAFSITKENKWILSILAECGIEYDCSIFPSGRSFGGFPEYKTKKPSLIHINGTVIKEFPISPTLIGGKDIVYSGGGYFRLFPYFKIKSLVKNTDYMMAYFHLKDFDKEQKRIYKSFQGESAIARYIKNYYGLNRNFFKFERLITDFDFISVEQADKMINWDNLPTIQL